MRTASAADRERLNALFAELCAIPSPSGEEGACAARVAVELRDLGAAPEPPDARGNLLARISGRGPRTILLCAHLDTVPSGGAIRPACEEGVWRNAEPGAILGADNKAALAVLLLAARRAVDEPPACGLELLFTVHEEDGLQGAKAFDTGRLTADWGYVLDHATPIGEIVLAAPTYFRLDAEFRGQSAHAGLHPEQGRSAILAAARAVAALPLGRLDAETTANAGRIRGGSAANVVAERCAIELEVRSLDRETAERVVGETVDACQDAANATECDVDVRVECLFHGYRTRPSAPAVRAAEAALRATGHEPRHIVTGGGSDANALEHRGFCCVNLANGTEHAHEPEERVSVRALEAMLDVVLALPEAAAGC